MRESKRHVLATCWVLTIATLGCGGGRNEADAPETPAPAAVAGSSNGQPATGETTAPKAEAAGANRPTFSPGPNAQIAIQEELILAEPGDVIQLEEGLFELTSGLSLDVANVTVRGRGMDKTILSFKNQEAGAEGLYVTSDHVTIEDLAIQDTKGNAFKSHTANDITLRRIRAEWTGGPKPTNGAYGIYPVSSRNVLIEACVAIGASDSGIYVGQSKNVIIRNCRVEYNVAGIEIENCYQAEAYGNTATHNTGGILVFDLPDLPQQRGHDIRVTHNRVVDNNTENFAPQGNIVANVPAGTGLMVMASTNVELCDNEVRNHGTVNLLVTSYLTTGLKIKDPNYVPYPSKIHVHHNTFGPCGSTPGGQHGAFMAQVAGTPLPDIVWDGVVAESTATAAPVLSIHDNQKTGAAVTFANLGGLSALADPASAAVTRDRSVYEAPLPKVPAVVIQPSASTAETGP